MLLFIHMHKCAGSTVRKSAQKSGFTLQPGHRNGNLVRPGGGIVKFANKSSSEVHQVIVEQEQAGVTFVALEFDFPNFDYLPREILTIFTVLRDPVDRAISNFRYAKSRGVVPADASFGDFLNKQFTIAGALSRSKNYFVRKLNSLPSLAPLGENHLERAKQILRSIEAVIVLGVDDLPSRLQALGIARFGSANVAAKREAAVTLSPEQAAVTDAERLWFVENNDLDQALFEFAKTSLV